MTSYTYLNEHIFNKPIHEVWKKISDTNRLHEISGAGTYEAEEVIMPDKSIVRHCHGYLGKSEVGNINWVWTERFGEWKAPFYLRQQRNFTAPIELTIKLEFFLHEIDKENCRLNSKLTFLVKNKVGNLLGFLNIYKKMSDNRWKGLIHFVNEDHDTPEPTAHWEYPNYTEEQLKKVNSLVEQVESSIFGHNLGKKVTNYAMHALAIDAVHMRPIQLADKWGLPEQDVIEVFLQSMASGLFDMKWDILCPQCRVSKAETGGLHSLPKGTHCSSCNIDFSLNFEENVEMTFLPSRWLRNIASVNFCMLSAQLTPHIIAQLRIAPGKEEVFENDMKDGNYRIRSLEDKFFKEFDLKKTENLFPEIILKDNGFEITPPKNNKLKLINKSQLHRFFIIEDLTFRKEALTIPKTLTLHAFRQLCPEQLVKPGDTIGISNITIMFTDLKDSTAFYQQIGETKAYQIVREHFGFLSEIISNNKGAIVKTIGDSVMAVFNDPKDAFIASIQIEKNLDNFNKQNNSNIIIKIALNQQGCISVNLNNLMDYFGSGVNTAARLLAFSDLKKFVISETIRNDPDVSKLLKRLNLKTIKHQESVKGIQKPINFYKVYY